MYQAFPLQYPLTALHQTLFVPMLKQHSQYQLHLLTLAIVKHFFLMEDLLATSAEPLAHVAEYNFETTL